MILVPGAMDAGLTIYRAGLRAADSVIAWPFAVAANRAMTRRGKDDAAANARH
jgi:hypothetical protein